MSTDKTIICSTDGSGLWSHVEKDIEVKGFVLYYREDGYTSKLIKGAQFRFLGELRVMFDQRQWHWREDGLIYTDRKWLANLKSVLREIGFSKKALNQLSYSEQGMQAIDYVSLDAGHDFIVECKSLSDPLVRFLSKNRTKYDFNVKIYEL